MPPRRSRRRGRGSVERGLRIRLETAGFLSARRGTPFLIQEGGALRAGVVGGGDRVGSRLFRGYAPSRARARFLVAPGSSE